MGSDRGLSLCAKYCEKYFFAHKNGLNKSRKNPAKKIFNKNKIQK
jgi:hypothetical protein